MNMSTPNPLVRHGLAALLIGMLLAVLGPYGSYPALPLLQRFSFWVGLSLFGYFCALITMMAMQTPPAFSNLAKGPRFILITLGSTLPQCFATAWAISLVQDGRVISAKAIPGLFLAVAAIQAIFVAVLIQGRQRTSNSAHFGVTDSNSAPVATAIGQMPSFMAQIPPHLGNDLLAVEAEDHYVRLHTQLGSHLIHMRMADALKELSCLDGLQVHRSWWVARNAVCRQRREGPQLMLELVNGTIAPVSRTFLMMVRSTLWPNLQPARNTGELSDSRKL